MLLLLMVLHDQSAPDRWQQKEFMQQRKIYCKTEHSHLHQSESVALQTADERAPFPPPEAIA